MSKKYIRVIADYGPVGDLAFGEVTDRIHSEMKKASVTDYHIDITNVPAFDTYATGFTLAQLAINSPLGADHFFYVNTAPRKDIQSARKNNEGEALVYAKLKNGVQIVAVNSGYSLTLIKPFAEEIRLLKVENEGSQFRSRDKFPKALGAVMRGDMTILGADVKDSVPDDVPENCVLYTDGYGNVKTNIAPEKIEKHVGQTMQVHVKGRDEQLTIEVGRAIFGVVDGEHCFAKGSSGWPINGTARREFSEIIKRGGSAAETLGHPRGGKEIEFRLAQPKPQ